jgi:hypothetical protein
MWEGRTKPIEIDRLGGQIGQIPILGTKNRGSRIKPSLDSYSTALKTLIATRSPNF